MDEFRKRSFVKTISWRVIATSITMSLVFLLTGELTLATSVGALDVISKLIFYYGHERLWNLIKWGKHKH